MTKEPTFRRSADGYPGWDAVSKLVEAGEYSRLAELLGDAQTETEQMGHTGLASILAAAHKICQACQQCQTDADWHRQAYVEADRRQQELQQQLYDILNVFSGHVSPEMETEMRSRAAPKGETGQTDDEPHQETRPSLWQRVQGLLGWGTDRGLAEKERSEKPVEASAAQAEETDAPTARSPTKDRPPDSQRTDEGASSVAPPADRSAIPAATQPETAPIGDSEPEGESTPMKGEKEDADTDRPSLVVYCLGAFRVYQDDSLITDWNGLKGLSILKYLAAHGGKPVAKDILMDTFWPDADPEAARRNLHQAIYSLRQTLRRRRSDFRHVQFENDCYLLNPEMDVWLDVEEFEGHLQAGRRLEAAGQLEEAMAEYGVAEGLYQGDFLEEDLYEDWPMMQREHLRNKYLDVAERLSGYYVERGEHTAAIALCQKTLMQDNCNEEAYRRLMQCYQAQGQRHLAIRQYQTCVEALREELDLSPSEETVELYRRISTAG